MYTIGSFSCIYYEVAKPQVVCAKKDLTYLLANVPALLTKYQFCNPKIIFDGQQILD